MARHLLGGSVFVNSRTDCAVTGGLTEAAFWNFMIQDIQFSLAYQRPLKMNIRPFSDCLEKAWESEQVLTERIWTHQAIWLLAETIQCCYTRPNDEGYSRPDVLRTKIKEWDVSKPESFEPLYFAEPETDSSMPFPKIWFSQPWHGK